MDRDLLLEVGNETAVAPLTRSISEGGTSIDPQSAPYACALCKLCLLQLLALCRKSGAFPSSC